MKDTWDDNSADMQAKILAFDQIMQHDENERDAQLAGARMPSGPSSPNRLPMKKPVPKRKKTNR